MTHNQNPRCSPCGDSFELLQEFNSIVFFPGILIKPMKYKDHSTLLRQRKLKFCPSFNIWRSLVSNWRILRTFPKEWYSIGIRLYYLGNPGSYYEVRTSLRSSIGCWIKYSDRTSLASLKKSDQSSTEYRLPRCSTSVDPEELCRLCREPFVDPFLVFDFFEYPLTGPI